MIIYNLSRIAKENFFKLASRKCLVVFPPHALLVHELADAEYVHCRVHEKQKTKNV